MPQELPRREVLIRSGLALGAAALAHKAVAAPGTLPNQVHLVPAKASFRYCLNTSTVRGQKLGIVAELELAARAGYQGVEPWIRELDEYAAAGGSLKELGKRARDLNLAIPSAIGFAEWIVDDAARRAKGLDEARRNMEMLVELGGERLAAPPTGATKEPGPELPVIAERYRTLLELGQRTGIVPELEVWGHSRTLSRLAEAVYVMVAADHPKACLLPDVYHLYRGGSDFAGLRLLSASAIPVFHFNDYPADPPRGELIDAKRVYPGDGVAPLGSILRDLAANRFDGYLSLELFNPGYYEQDALAVAKTGLEKMQAAVELALGNA